MFLLTQGITINKDNIKIMLTYDEIINIYNSIESLDLHEKIVESSYASSKTNVEQSKSYLLYSKLGNLIQN